MVAGIAACRYCSSLSLIKMFHKKLSQLVTNASVIDKVVGQDELPPQPEDDSESEAMATEEEMIKECPDFNFGHFIQLNSTDSPYLLKLFGGEGKVLKSHLNAILLELFQVLGKKTSASVEFEYKK
jgi:hypothetical protein